MAIMEGGNPREKLEKSYLSGLKANWMLWPAVQAINFRLVPLEHRVLVVNIVSLGKESMQIVFISADLEIVGWNCFLSYLNSGK
jgi:protein Mpv17